MMFKLDLQLFASKKGLGQQRMVVTLNLKD